MALLTFRNQEILGTQNSITLTYEKKKFCTVCRSWHWGTADAFPIVGEHHPGRSLVGTRDGRGPEKEAGRCGPGDGQIPGGHLCGRPYWKISQPICLYPGGQGPECGQFGILWNRNPGHRQRDL